jgi:hypothetical protein
MFPLVQPGLERPSVHETRVGQSLDAVFAAPLHEVFGAMALKTLELEAISPPWMHHETTPIALSGAYADVSDASPAPRPASGPHKDGRGDLKQVLVSLGVSGAGGLPWRMGRRDGHTSESVEVPQAIAESLALGLNGFQGLVAAAKASRQPPGACAWSSRWAGARGCPGQGVCVRRWQPGASSNRPCPWCSSHRLGGSELRPDGGPGAVAPARARWQTGTVASRWLPCALWWCMRTS